MSYQVGDFMIDRLSEWGIHRIYGYPGDGINGILGALERSNGKIEFIQARHEELAAFMACGHAKFTGEVGVCLATSGPGAIHLLNGLYDAKLDHQPVVAIIGQQARAAIGGSYQQEIDLLSLFKDVAQEYVFMASDPVQIRHLIDRSIRIAKSERTVTCIIVPNDVQMMDAVTVPPRKHGTVHTGVGHAKTRIIPPMSEIEEAAQILNEGKKVAILIGAGALHAADEVTTVAQLLGAGVAKALLGKAALPDGLPYVTGSIGLLGTKPSWDMMNDCDTLLMIGSSFPYSEFLPKEGQARGVQIDIDARFLSLRYPMEINLHGDSKETLAELIPLLQYKADRNWQDGIIDNVRKWWKMLEDRAMTPAKPINPQRVFWELSPRLPDDCIVTADSGSAAIWFARDLVLRKGMKASLSGTLATMCPSVPYSIAAKFAYPGRAAIALVGDGAMQMLGINGLITIAKYWKQWTDPRLIVLVLNNQDLNMVTWEQRVLSGDPKFEDSQNLPDFPYAEFARSLGLFGIKVDDPEKVGEAWDVVLAANKPAVFEVLVDPAVPPIPPHVSFEQMMNLGKSLLKGDPEEKDIIKQTLKEMVK
jgi:pyruvate dehydrogenase (quinone)